ncbi:helix-turn-helix domain-containing protein [Steroidobacter sp.]|uniref:helix-turn-helix domain-containing protein n=1 Tax=Steroidobacter sp. TaxID=1978227 RepID=UPI001A453CE9|nr:AraC family transcriptional regulator [Steroidobacter sp.]MBL8267092.1 helix-turn-helix transcriptional regulator [Steroidobacter sp.]
MPDVIFACDGHNYRGREREYRGANGQEYYEGDYEILPEPHINIRIDKGLSCTSSILNLRSISNLRFRRGWHHIRRDKTDVCVLWFVKHGSIVHTSSAGKVTMRTGECMITRSSQPFVMDCLVDDRSIHEVLHVIGPTHLFRSFIPDDVPAGTVLSAAEGDCHLAKEAFWLLYNDGASVSRKAAEQFVNTAASAVGTSLLEAANQPLPVSITDKRYEDILTVIQGQLSNPDLSVTSAARACGISPRYLTYILSSQGTCFSDLLWLSRLERAQAWLVDSTMKQVPIAKISYLAGFKSPAHFCRMFKAAKGVTPGEFRAFAGQPASGEMAVAL